jgi:ribosome maturation factor RimP
MEELKQKIENWLQPKLEEENLFLVDVVIGATYKIQVFIDALPFITIEKCVKVSRFLESYLDEDGSVPENYNLEVSSPGMTNALKVPMQYKKSAGKVLKIHTEAGQNHVIKVTDADDEKVWGIKTVLIENKTKNKSIKPSSKADESEEVLEFLFSDIKQAKIHFNI